MANPDYYDLRKLHSLVGEENKLPKNNPNTALYYSDKFTPSANKMADEAKKLKRNLKKRGKK